MAKEIYEAKQILRTSGLELAIPRCVSRKSTHIDGMEREAGVPLSKVNGSRALKELLGVERQAKGIDHVLAREAKADYVLQ